MHAEEDNIVFLSVGHKACTDPLIIEGIKDNLVGVYNDLSTEAKIAVSMIS